MLIITCIVQLFPIHPGAGNIYEYYKSGYFIELDKEFSIIKDSYIAVKSMGNPEYGWVYLADIGKKFKILIKVYDDSGAVINLPGEKGNTRETDIVNVINTPNPVPYSRIKENRYYSAIPVISDNSCKFCHKNKNNGDIIGVITFESEFDSHIYYSSERIIIFSFLSLIFLIFIWIIIKWEPGKKIKEMFDNK